MQSYWVWKSYLREAPCPAGDAQHEMNSKVFLEIFVSHSALFGHFLLPVLLLIMVSNFMFLWVHRQVAVAFSLFVYLFYFTLNYFLSVFFLKRRRKKV